MHADDAIVSELALAAACLVSGPLAVQNSQSTCHQCRFAGLALMNVDIYLYLVGKVKRQYYISPSQLRTVRIVGTICLHSAINPTSPHNPLQPHLLTVLLRALVREFLCDVRLPGLLVGLNREQQLLGHILISVAVEFVYSSADVIRMTPPTSSSGMRLVP